MLLMLDLFRKLLKTFLKDIMHNKQMKLSITSDYFDTSQLNLFYHRNNSQKKFIILNLRFSTLNFICELFRWQKSVTWQVWNYVMDK